MQKLVKNSIQRQISPGVIEPAKNFLFFDYYRIIRNLYPETSIIESNCDYNPETANYSLIGVLADEKIFEENDKYFKYIFNTREKISVNWLEIIDKWYGQNKSNNNSIFAPGTVGYISYEEKHSFEKLDKLLVRDHDVPTVYLVHYKLVLIQDKKSGEIFWCYEDDGWTDYKGIIGEIESRSSKNPAGIETRSRFHVLGDIINDFSETEYISIIEKTIEHIKAGDIFQANITMRIHGNYIGDPFVLYELIRSQKKNPFFAYFDFKYPLISTSPERFIKLEGQKIVTNPIKGTIKAVIDGVDQGYKLKESVKNNAENTMITDLMRNDIGRVCKKDSINVSALCKLKCFNDLYHLESVVEGELDGKIPLSRILKAIFPGGSITGAPKIKSIDIIEALEKTTRGPYTGMLTFFNQNSYLDSAIGIRIIYFDDKRFYLHSGGGIVAKSLPQDELNELNLKIDNLKQMLTQCNILKEHRAEIETIDTHLFDLLDRRFKIVDDVAILKEKYEIPVLQQDRVAFLKKRGQAIEDKNKNLPSGFSSRLYTFLIGESMNKEEALIAIKKEKHTNLKLNVAASLEDDFLEKVAQYPEVKVVFGKMKSDFIGGGVESKLLKDISYDEFIDYVKKAQSLGINFNYVINAPVMGNDEFTAKGRQKLDELLIQLNKLDLEAVTVANPFLIQYIKKKYSNIPVKASSIMMIDSVRKAKFVKNLGADIIVLDSLLANRDFVNLKKIREEINGEIEIMLNNNCIMNCPMLMYHQTYLANNSRDNNKAIDIDYCYLNCSRQRIENPVNLIRSEWIRPEDLHYYEKIGYDRFKITDRSTPTDILLKRIKAYVDRSYEGNLLDLIIHYGYADEINQHDYYNNVYIDNKALDGFIERFVDGHCDGKNCVASCTHCQKYTDKSVKINEEFRNRIVDSKKQKLEKIFV